MNPFMGSMPIENINDWIGSKKIFETLDFCVRQRANTCIMGVEGSGKTSLLHCCFSFPYRKKMAVEKKVLVYSADLSNKTDGEAICACLADQLKYAVRRLLKDEGVLEDIMDALVRLDARSATTELYQIISLLHNEYGYFIVLVMDHFELFTSSARVTMEHHEIFRSLIDNGSMQCIVATNYDLSQDSLPRDVKGSFYLQKFTQSITMNPLTEYEVFDYIRKKQNEPAVDIKMNEKQIAAVYRLSGGIPLVMEITAKCVYDVLEQNGGKMDGKKATTAAFDNCQPLFRSWCKLLTFTQVEVLSLLASRAQNNNEFAAIDFTGDPSYEKEVLALKKRGILQKKKALLDETGNPLPVGDYEVSFNSLLFQSFCKSGLIEEAVRRNPLLPQESKNVPVSGESTIVNISISNEQKINHQILNADTIQLIYGITPSGILKMLSDSQGSREQFANKLSFQLEQSLAQKAFILPESVDRNKKEAQAVQEYDQEFDRVGKCLIQDVAVDNEEDFVDITEDELRTLDERFCEARDRSRPMMTDEFVNTQSERCRFYLKLSVVVEDALNAPCIAMDDYSPQLVLYGKALEQSLIDNLYDLFHEDEVLSTYSTVSGRTDPNDKDNFYNRTRERTFIGSYAFLIEAKGDYLAGLCKESDVTYGEAETSPTRKEWWNQLQADIHSARNIRNLADHAGSIGPEKRELDRMCELLVGSGEKLGILKRVSVGKLLARKVLPAEIPAEVIQRITGTTCEMVCTVLKTSGGIKGYVCDENKRYHVNISPRKVQKYCRAVYGGTIGRSEFHPEGKKFTVKILECKRQDGRQFFAADLVC